MDPTLLFHIVLQDMSSPLMLHFLVQTIHNIIKQFCIHSCGSQEYDNGLLQLVHIQSKCALDATSHGHILKAHTNKCTMLGNVMLPFPSKVMPCTKYLTLHLLFLGPLTKSLWSNLHLTANKIASFCWVLPFGPHLTSA